MIDPDTYHPPYPRPIGRGGYVDIYDPEQHDHHCYLVCGGVAWRIYAVRSVSYVLLRAFYPDGYCVVSRCDLSGLRVDEYAEKAVTLDKQATS